MDLRCTWFKVWGPFRKIVSLSCTCWLTVGLIVMFYKTTVNWLLYDAVFCVLICCERHHFTRTFCGEQSGSHLTGLAPYPSAKWTLLLSFRRKLWKGEFPSFLYANCLVEGHYYPSPLLDQSFKPCQKTTATGHARFWWYFVSLNPRCWWSVWISHCYHTLVWLLQFQSSIDTVQLFWTAQLRPRW